MTYFILLQPKIIASHLKVCGLIDKKWRVGYKKERTKSRVHDTKIFCIKTLFTRSALLGRCLGLIRSVQDPHENLSAYLVLVNCWDLRAVSKKELYDRGGRPPANA